MLNFFICYLIKKLIDVLWIQKQKKGKNVIIK